jgi:hypothetical protein
LDIAPHLIGGRNVIAAVVWNFGELAPEALKFVAGSVQHPKGMIEVRVDAAGVNRFPM